MTTVPRTDHLMEGVNGILVWGSTASYQFCLVPQENNAREEKREKAKSMFLCSLGFWCYGK